MGADLPLAGHVALVGGATRGAGRGAARELGEAGALVYCTGRSSAGGGKGMDRPETIDETAALIEQAGAGPSPCGSTTPARTRSLPSSPASARKPGGSTCWSTASRAAIR